MATGDTLVVFGALSVETPSTDYATIDARNNHHVLDFEPTTNKRAVFSTVMPQHYSGGGITPYLHYSMTSATTGDVDWDIEFERIGDQVLDIDSDSFGTVNSIDNTTVPSTAGFVDVVSVSVASSDAASIAAGEKFRVRVTRDAASDTATGDAEFHAIELRET